MINVNVYIFLEITTVIIVLSLAFAKLRVGLNLKKIALFSYDAAVNIHAAFCLATHC